MRVISKKHKNLIIMIVLIIALAMLHLYIQNKSIALKYEYAKLKMEFQKIYDQNRYYNSLVSQRSSLDRIERIATEKTKMIYPEDIKYIVGSGEAE